MTPKPPIFLYPIILTCLIAISFIIIAEHSIENKTTLIPIRSFVNFSQLSPENDTWCIIECLDNWQNLSVYNAHFVSGMFFVGDERLALRPIMFTQLWWTYLPVDFLSMKEALK